MYRADYPELTWLSPGETVIAEAERRAVIEKDLNDYPGDSDPSRALRLRDQLGVQERRERDGMTPRWPPRARAGVRGRSPGNRYRVLAKTSEDLKSVRPRPS
jgi:hypothetical protein